MVVEFSTISSAKRLPFGWCLFWTISLVEFSSFKILGNHVWAPVHLKDTSSCHLNLHSFLRGAEQSAKKTSCTANTEKKIPCKLIHEKKCRTRRKKTTYTTWSWKKILAQKNCSPAPKKNNAPSYCLFDALACLRPRIKSRRLNHARALRIKRLDEINN